MQLQVQGQRHSKEVAVIIRYRFVDCRVKCDDSIWSWLMTNQQIELQTDNSRLSFSSPACVVARPSGYRVARQLQPGLRDDIFALRY